jgi:C1A family cysteine protease
MKAWLAKYGPLVACFLFSAYEDFYSYRSGIYHHVSGALVGGSSVSCVGDNDAKPYWICRNSWTSSWGERGFFRIVYGQCAIDAGMRAVQI